MFVAVFAEHTQFVCEKEVTVLCLCWKSYLNEAITGLLAFQMLSANKYLMSYTESIFAKASNDRARSLSSFDPLRIKINPTFADAKKRTNKKFHLQISCNFVAQ